MMIKLNGSVRMSNTQQPITNVISCYFLKKKTAKETYFARPFTNVRLILNERPGKNNMGGKNFNSKINKVLEKMSYEQVNDAFLNVTFF